MEIYDNQDNKLIIKIRAYADYLFVTIHSLFKFIGMPSPKMLIVI